MLVSWQHDVGSPAEIQSPIQADDTLFLCGENVSERHKNHAMPIVGLEPSRFVPSAAVSLLCVQRPWEQDFEIFVLIWDISQRKYSLVNAGGAWLRDSHGLHVRKPATLRARLDACEHLAPSDAKICKTPCSATFLLSSVMPYAADIDDHDLPSSAKFLREWLESENN